MAITADMVKKLREQTGAGMMDCKKALTETNGDYEKAVNLLREKGIAVAAKRESKSASEGMIGSYISADSKVGVLVELNCETTFVAKTDEFVTLAKDLAKFVAETNSCDCLDTLLELPFKGDQSVVTCVNEVMGKVGEKMTLSRFVRFDTDGVIGSYIHLGDQIGVMVDLKTGVKNDDIAVLAKDLAMHISWSSPEYLVRDEIPESVLANEREVHRQWAIKEGKPENIIDRIIEGRMKDFYSKVCLMEQAFIKDEDQTISSLIENVAKKVEGEIAINRYVRFRVGETTSVTE